jgi:hypothetical protein
VAFTPLAAPCAGASAMILVLACVAAGSLVTATSTAARAATVAPAAAMYRGLDPGTLFFVPPPSDGVPQLANPALPTQP